MLKKLIAPVQMLLLKNGQCVGCGRQLKSGKVIEEINGNEKLISCYCGRIFVKNAKGYRRALIEEVK
ncbi:hypothetical protein COX08_04595 [Candidatus Beckwithbacteria bacterium CG23_combo_of_CG06-09_8_20_14_all_34_8]|uniref:Uncharacterized protein n=1 Tax=Candidatus Beckwithbacteria bacterium CG23_combo_of_CG06-09_8_20_14_all_34_8 TaxID=1974497 RepID=A0A2H0B542_9BACT|nr:MAG: hypothetical protein COX08_04595 [Candidatus Beckwithbacteria bacterium CG23_combo_of_CG06-09_8_20_14_all_34_8]